MSGSLYSLVFFIDWFTLSFICSSLLFLFSLSSCSIYPFFLVQVFTPPEPDSTREDLQYYEHEVDPREDWMVRSKKEWWDLLRVPTNPLDLAVIRLTNLERNIERRYLKAPLWNLAEVMRLVPLTSPPGGEEIAMDTIR